MTALEVLNQTTSYLRKHRIENPRLNAELLLAHTLNFSRERLYTNLHHHFKAGEKETLERLIKRRVSGEPLQYILGHQEFWSTDFKVDSRVLIPRPETELLVELSLSILSEASLKRTPVILEIGTGSGALAVSLAKEMKNIFIVATDISKGALLLARENAEASGILQQIEFVNGDLFSPFRPLKGNGPFDMILSNPPYINRSEIKKLAREIKDYEPIVALDGGEDGMEFFRSIISQAPFYLYRGGWLLLEVGEGQGSKVSWLIEKEGHFNLAERMKDLSGVERVVTAQIRQ